MTVNCRESASCTMACKQAWSFAFVDLGLWLVEPLRSREIHQVQCAVQFLKVGPTTAQPGERLRSPAECCSRLMPWRYKANIECERDDDAFISVAPTSTKAECRAMHGHVCRIRQGTDRALAAVSISLLICSM